MLFRDIVIVGIGNPLFYDDGFGPLVVEELQKLDLPDNIKVIDGGGGASHFLFTMMFDENTTVKKLVIIDIVEMGARPGEVARLTPDLMPKASQQRYYDAHAFHAVDDLLAELEKRGVEVTIFGCQYGHVTEPDFEIGLTEEVKLAIPKTVRLVLEEIGVDYGTTISNQESLHGVS